MYTYDCPSLCALYRRKDPPVTSHHLGQAQSTARQIYASQTKVRQLTDANFWNIFYDRTKIIVVAFWADWCRPCDGVAGVMASIADRYSQGPFARLVKFYHVQWDERVNPRVHERFGFKSIPVVFFYYTATGRQPTKTAPLLEGSLGADKRQYDPNEYVRRIEAILRRHGHVAPALGVTVSEKRGWKTSRELLTANDFAHVDQLLTEPSTFQQYFADLYRANPATRFSRAATILIKSSFETQYQKINGSLPGPDDAGTLDKASGRIFLLSVNRWLQVYLGRAVHEAVHLFSCPVQGPHTSFYRNYGFGITEGFTQFVTEEILKSQKLRVVTPSPYRNERAVVAKLIQVVGLNSLADDYFRCTRKVHEHLERIRMFGEFRRLSVEADRQQKDYAKKEAYEKLIRFLDTIKSPNAG